MQYSHSRIECFNNCPYQYKLRYIDKIKTIPDPEPNDALICGNTIHTGAEKNLEEALKFYKSNFNVMTDKHINEIIKFEILIPKLKNLLANIKIYAQEYLISTSRFKGFIDLITKNNDGSVDIFDFKYSNNVEKYLKSPQLSLYKYFLEQQGFKVRKLGFIFVPKTSIRQKKDEDLYQFRKRLVETVESQEIILKEVKYNPNHVIEFFNNIINTKEIKDYTKNVTKLCDWCEYKEYCQKGIDYMLLPKVERVEINEVSFMKGWIYGAPFSGKTTFLDSAPDPLNLNTDGNVKYVTMQRILIRDEVKVEGRITKRTFAWEVFKEAIDELEKGSAFKTIIIDLAEDTREMCRIYMYDRLGIQHESDSGFGKGWDIIKTEYLSTMRRLLNLPYNIFLVSHEDISKDITKKSGDKITKIAPNIQEAIANKLAGMVDFVARVIVNEDGTRSLSFKQNEVTFGGGRLGIKEQEIPLEWDKLLEVYNEAKAEANKRRKVKKDNTPKEESKEETSNTEIKEETSKEEEQKEDKPKKTRRSRKKDEE